jgi:hypothetical protein
MEIGWRESEARAESVLIGLSPWSSDVRVETLFNPGHCGGWPRRSRAAEQRDSPSVLHERRRAKGDKDIKRNLAGF